MKFEALLFLPNGEFVGKLIDRSELTKGHRAIRNLQPDLKDHRSESSSALIDHPISQLCLYFC